MYIISDWDDSCGGYSSYYGGVDTDADGNQQKSTEVRFCSLLPKKIIQKLKFVS